MTHNVKLGDAMSNYNELKDELERIVEAHYKGGSMIFALQFMR